MSWVFATFVVVFQLNIQTNTAYITVKRPIPMNSKKKDTTLKLNRTALSDSFIRLWCWHNLLNRPFNPRSSVESYQCGRWRLSIFSNEILKFLFVHIKHRFYLPPVSSWTKNTSSSILALQIPRFIPISEISSPLYLTCKFHIYHSDMDCHPCLWGVCIWHKNIPQI